MGKHLSFFKGLVVSIIAMIIAFIVLFILIKILAIAAAVALVVFLLFAIITRPKGRRPDYSGSAEEIKDPSLKDAFEKGIGKLNKLTGLKNKISKREIRAKVDKIIDVVKRIFDDFREDPKDIKAGRQFLNYYLDSTIKIIEQYTELSAKSVKDVELEATLAKSEELLDKVYHSFEVQLAKLQENDIMDLDTEIKLLEQTLKMEGLDKRTT